MTELAPPSRPTPGFDRERLRSVIEPVVHAHGAELCDFELKNENGWVLRIYVEKLGAQEQRLSTKAAAVDLDLCANISRDLSPALDVADPITGRYHLEVGSPGVERPLRKVDDFVRFSGEKAKLKLKAGIAGQKVIVGKLVSVDTKTNIVQVEEGVRTYPVPIDDVVAARLVFEFGPPASKPGQPPGSGRRKKRKQ